MSLTHWETESTELEFDMMDYFHEQQGKNWGNSYVAITRTAVEFGVPRYIVEATIQHYDEIVHDI